MTGKIDKDLEKKMMQALKGLKEMQRDQENKRDKRFWSEMTVPFTLFEGLGQYTKNELDDIRKSLGLSGVSNLKKADLIVKLQEAIQYTDKVVCLHLDAERFRLLTKIAHNGGYIDAPNLEPHQIGYLRATGLVFTGTINDKKILALPNELIEPIKLLEQDIQVISMIKRNTEWIKLTNGLLYYYGTLDVFKLLELLKSYTEQPINFSEYNSMIQTTNSYNKAILINQDGFSNIRVFDPKQVKQEHQMRKAVPYFPFTKKQLLKAGEPGFVERNNSYQQFVHFLTKNYNISQTEADSIVEECLYATRTGASPNSIIKYLGERFEFESLESVQALMNQVVFLMNNTRQWFLKGHTSLELSKQEKKSLLSIPKATSDKQFVKSEEKVSRNASCPCRSGKKYKKCCGS